MGDINEELKSRLVLNQCQTNTTLAKEALEILPEFGIELAKSRLAQRQVYRQSAAYGATVYDLGSKAREAIREINALASEVLKIIS